MSSYEKRHHNLTSIMYYHEKQKAVNVSVYRYILVDSEDFRCLLVSEAAIPSEVGHVPVQ